LNYARVSAKSSTEQWFVRGRVICKKEKSELGGQRETTAEGSEKETMLGRCVALDHKICLKNGFFVANGEQIIGIR